MDSFYKGAIMAKKKKYYQSPKDKRREGQGMKHVWKVEFPSPADYNARKKFEDSAMIREDHSAVANLPQHVIQREWPKPYYGNLMGPDDTISGIDLQMKDDSDEMKSHSYPEKY
jgi:hypothetical protein